MSNTCFASTCLPSSATHSVQFYSDESCLSCVVAEFIIVGLEKHEGVFLIAVPDHIEKIEEHLRKKNIAIDDMKRHQQFVVKSVEEIVSKCLVDGDLNEQILFQYGKGVCEALHKSYGRVRGYGEMVDILLKYQAFTAAMQNEIIWNQLSSEFQLTLLCGCNILRFQPEPPTTTADLDTSKVLQFRDISSVHTRLSMADDWSPFVKQMFKLMELKANEKVKRDFVRYIFHEARVPLNALTLGISQLQNEQSLMTSMKQNYPESYEIIHLLAEQAQAITTILNDVLSLQKIEDRRLKLVKSVFDVRQVIEKAIDCLSSVSLSRNLHLTFNKRVTVTNTKTNDVMSDKEFTNAYLAYADPFRLKQVCCNLMSNAIKFSKEGGTIQVKLHFKHIQYDNGTMNPQSIRISIIDNGCGIAPEHHSSVFQQFTQFDAGRIQEGSSGLGLHICKLLVELHDGKIGFSSVPDQETEFWFEIPQAPLVHNYADELALGTQNCYLLNDTTSSKISTPSTHIPRALVVEDSPPNLKLLLSKMRNLGFEAEGCRDGKECCDLFDRSSARSTLFDVILMDSSMPNMNGIEATNYLRTIGVNTPIIGVTGNALQEDIEIFKNAGAQHVLTKPLDQSALVDTLNKFCSKT